MCCLWLPLNRRRKKEPKVKKTRDAFVGEHESLGERKKNKTMGEQEKKERDKKNQHCRAGKKRRDAHTLVTTTSEGWGAQAALL